jgi:hypothetical protein
MRHILQRSGRWAAWASVLALFCAPAPAQTCYKGLFAPGIMLTNFSYSMDDPGRLQQDGFNIVSVTPIFGADINGNVTQCTSDAEIIAEIQQWHTNGLDVALIPILFYYTNNCPINNTTQLLDVIAMTDVMTNAYKTVVSNLAALADTYCVDVFSPYNEPDKHIGSATSLSNASDWGQFILPHVTNHYSGKVLYKVGFVSSIGSLNFTNYGIIGVTLTPGGSTVTGYSNSIVSAMALLDTATQAYDVPEQIISELGPFENSTWTNAAGDQTHSNAYQLVFEEGYGKMDGFFTFEGTLAGVTILAGTDAELVISNWFNEILCPVLVLPGNNLEIFKGGDADGFACEIESLLIDLLVAPTLFMFQ